MILDYARDVQKYSLYRNDFLSRDRDLKDALSLSQYAENELGAQIQPYSQQQN